MTRICVMRSHKPTIIYMGDLILGVNTLYRVLCFFKLFPMVGKGLKYAIHSYGLMEVSMTDIQVYRSLVGKGLIPGVNALMLVIKYCTFIPSFPKPGNEVIPRFRSLGTWQRGHS